MVSTISTATGSFSAISIAANLAIDLMIPLLGSRMAQHPRQLPEPRVQQAIPVGHQTKADTQTSTSTRDCATQTKHMDKKVEPTNWLTQGTKAFNDGVRHGEEEFSGKYAPILELLQNDAEIAEAADILRNARMVQGPRAGKWPQGFC